MNTAKADLQLGLILTAFFALLVFWLVPAGIVVPQTHDSGQLSPAAYPTWISMTGLCVSLMLTLSSFMKIRRKTKKTNKTTEKKEKIFKFSDYTVVLLAFFSLFVFYFLMETLGMMLGGFILYAIFAVFCGEKNWKRLFISDTILMMIMYAFFIKVAAVPIPLGILQNIL